MNDRLKAVILVAAFLIIYYAPIDGLRIWGPIDEALALTQWYAREHVLLCLVPAFLIAGAISIFVSQASVMKYFGAKANKVLSYSVASVSGTLLAVCSCTVLPLFSGIYRRGAGLGPAIAFLYSGPAINVLAIILTARVLGWKLGLARAGGAIIFSIVIGLAMHFIFLKDERERQAAGDLPIGPVSPGRPLWQNAFLFGPMVIFLIFANWGRPPEGEGGVWASLYQIKWWVAGGAVAALFFAVRRWVKRDELSLWGHASWGFALQTLPLLLGGVMLSGFLLGRVGHEGIIPSRFIEMLVGGNSLGANLFASVAGALMYFATLTEVPILQGLIGSGMGQGPALALLLAGPALSLPSLLVLKGIIGFKRTAVYAALVTVMAAVSGILYGFFIGS